jgi:hypothetical protein
MPSPPDAENRRPIIGDTGSDKTTRANKPLGATVPHSTDEVPSHRPWARRRDARDVERRFRIDQACWRRRIEFARRMRWTA